MTRELEPWRQWLNRYDAAPVPGPLQAWTVTIDEVGVVVELDVLAGLVRVNVLLPQSLAALSMVSAEHALYTKKRVFTGDASLDDAVVIHVPLTSAYAAFDADQRRVIRRLVAAGVSASGGMLRWAPEEERPEIASVVAGMVDVARRLALPELEARLALARIIERDPNPSVRATFERAFGGADDIREARAVLSQEAGTHGDARLGLLASRLLDASLTAEARQFAFQTLLTEYLPAEFEQAVWPWPKGNRGMFLLALKRLELVTERVHAQSLARIALELAHGLALGASEIKAFAQHLAPLALPEAVEFLVGCTQRLDSSIVDLAFGGLLTIDRDAEDVLKGMPDGVQTRMAWAARELVWKKPERMGAAFHRLYERNAVLDGELCVSFLDTMTSVHRVMREQGRGRHTWHERDRAIAHDLVTRNSIANVIVAACDLLAEVGEATDIATLSPMTEGFFRSSIVKEAARNAIALIMKRENVRAETGALALSEGYVGGLSEPESP